MTRCTIDPLCGGPSGYYQELPAPNCFNTTREIKAKRRPAAAVAIAP